MQALGITDDPTPDRLVFDPNNPEADPRGYVHYPNVEIVKEMVDLMAASRAYQANVAAITASQNMGGKTFRSSRASRRDTWKSTVTAMR